MKKFRKDKIKSEKFVDGVFYIRELLVDTYIQHVYGGEGVEVWSLRMV